MPISKPAGPATILLCAAGLILAAFAGTAGAGRGDAPRATSAARPSAGAEAPAGALQPTLPGNGPDQALTEGSLLKPRKPLQKMEIVSVPEKFNGTIVVKLNDDVPAYALAATERVEALRPDGRIDLVNEVLERFGMKARPAFNASLERMAALENKAAGRSGKAQPRLANMLHVTGPAHSVLAAARELNGLDCVEWVHLQEERVLFGPTGACCLPTLAGCTENLLIGDCISQGGVYQGDGSTCDGPCSVCCVADECFDLITETLCSSAGGNWVENESCANEDFECENECGSDQVGNCFEADGNGGPFCDDEVCCNAICACDPFCCRQDANEIGTWDEFCAAQANYLCNPHTSNPGGLTQPPNGPDHCGSPLNGSCFEEHGTSGCNNKECCDTVCEENPLCCDAFEWDINCVRAAQNLCVGPLPSNPAAPTPDYTALQGYTREGGYGLFIPPDLAPFLPIVGGQPFKGYGGEGWNLGGAGEPFNDVNDNFVRDAGESFTDLNLNGIWDRTGGGEPFTDVNHNGWWDLGEPYVEQSEPDGIWNPGETFTDQDSDGFYDLGEPFTDSGDGIWQGPGGLRGFAEELKFKLGIDQVGAGNLATGRGAKAVVIEWSCYPNHEDMDIIVEPGQTLLDVESVTNPNHGTACASIVGARNNTFGTTGIAYDIDAVYFYPLTSEEEGWRETSAWFNAIEFLDPGDVITASYGAPPINLNCVPDQWILFRIASDLGITVCVAAGNSTFNLDGADDFGDSGAIVVGACSPGFPWFRLGFSNYCTEPDLERGNIIHVRAWGDLVACAGYGNLFRIPQSVLPGLPDNPNRRYTPTFGGTSAASPQIAGLVVCLQGLAKMFYGVPHSPETIRSLLGAPGGTPPGNRFFLIGGFPPPFCQLDLDPGLGPNRFGGYPNAVGLIGGLIAQPTGGFDGAPSVDDVVIVRGEHIFGNVFSLKQAGDFNRLLVKSVYTERDQGISGNLVGEGPNGDNVIPTQYPQIGQVSYLGTGQITDVVVIGHSTAQIATTFTIQYEPVNVPVDTMVFIEAYDWLLGRWSFVGFNYVAAGGGGGIFEYPGGDATRFISDTPGQLMLGRVWTLGFTLGGDSITGPNGQAGRDEYITGMDFFNFAIGDQLGEGP